MRFDSFLQALDMGRCQDQIQREALFDIALMLVLIDGVVTESEQAFMHEWLNSLPWNAETSKDAYYDVISGKCHAAMQTDTVESFIQHRAAQIVDPELRQQAAKLVEDIAHADEELHPKELAVIDIMHECFGN